jgi:hypothetical protein
MAKLDRWPALPLRDWDKTYTWLHLASQIVGKVALALAPMTNQWWQAALHPTVRGLGTDPLPHGDRILALEIDWLDHVLRIAAADGLLRQRPLGGPIREVWAWVMRELEEIGGPVPLWHCSVEMPIPVALDRTELHDYVPSQAARCHQVLMQVDRVLRRFRAEFRGKATEPFFWWGGFDLTVDLFSGRMAPPRPGADRIMRFGMDEEYVALGFWPGGASAFGPVVDEPVFFAYAAPKPDGFEQAPVPSPAFWHPELGEFLLRYEDVRRSAEPDELILEFGRQVRQDAIRLGHWPPGTEYHPEAALGPVIFAPEQPTEASRLGLREPFAPEQPREG